MKYKRRNKRTRRRRKRKGGEFPGPETKKRMTEGISGLAALGEKTGNVANAMTESTIRLGSEANQERKKNEAMNEQKYTSQPEAVAVEPVGGRKHRRKRRKSRKKKRKSRRRSRKKSKRRKRRKSRRRKR